MSAACVPVRVKLSFIKKKTFDVLQSKLFNINFIRNLIKHNVISVTPGVRLSQARPGQDGRPLW